jgi:hypothetical protein
MFDVLSAIIQKKHFDAKSTLNPRNIYSLKNYLTVVTHTLTLLSFDFGDKTIEVQKKRKTEKSETKSCE